jgi:hypothetical protein
VSFTAITLYDASQRVFIVVSVHFVIVSVRKLLDAISDWTIGVLGFDSRRELGIFLFTTVSETALGPTKPPIQWVTGTFSLGVNRPGREADHSPPSSAEVKDAWSYTSTPQYVFMAWCLVKHRNNFTFYLYPRKRKQRLADLGRSNTAISGSNSRRVVCLRFSVLCCPCDGPIPAQGFLPNV